MQLRQVLQRTVIVVACLPTSWHLIRTNALDSVPDRFRHETRLSRLPSAEIGMQLVAARFEPTFTKAGFQPPYPTWPIPESAFVNARDVTPRQLLEQADKHIRTCLRHNDVLPLTDLKDLSDIPAPAEPPLPPTELEALDSRFAELCERARVDAALDERTEDMEMPGLLEAGLTAWITEQGDRRERYAVYPGQGTNPPVHAMLTETLDPATEDEIHWYFRGIVRTHHKAVLPRIERVRVFAALDPAVPKRKAIILRPRSVKWPRGPVTTRKRQEFTKLGGVITEASADDLRTFAALRTMIAEKQRALSAWLTSRMPASRTTLLSEILGPAPGQPATTGGDPHGPPPSDDTGHRGTSHKQSAGQGTFKDQEPAEAVNTIVLGSATDTGTAVRIGTESLRKHTVIFAGSGSGKTVLIRRLIEECALQGVSTIALDPNNDLARLGDPWPYPPSTWRGDDAARAAAYFTGTDVVVWTPRRESGRPLSLQPLPDFAAVLDDPDDFELALDTAVAALAPRARVGGNTAKMDRGRAILREAMAYYARRGGSRLTGFIDLLADLPDDVTTLSKAVEIADDMAQTLTAAMINDPLFGGSGVPLDLGVLLTPAPGKRARISVVSLVGLPTNEQRQSFVNQLQMALFAWIKRNPAGGRPLGGLFVMDEAQTLAPSGAMTACTESTLALASQARKYGLGLIFATQAPRGIHNRIVGNAATQFFGFLNSPVQINAAKEMAQAKSSAVVDISRLTAGQFYAVGEGMPFQKVVTPMCLSHHPKSALTTEEVLERARA
jgi:hypothetical protein